MYHKSLEMLIKEWISDKDLKYEIFIRELNFDTCDIIIMIHSEWCSLIPYVVSN